MIEGAMIVQCPNCKKQLKLGEKIRESVRQLEPGRRIKIKCAYCGSPFGLDRSMEQSTSPAGRSGDAPSQGRRVRPPDPPDIGWVKDGTFEEKEVIEDIPRALVLMPDMPGRDEVVKAATSVGYRVELGHGSDEAVEKMMFVNFAAVFLHDRFETGGVVTGKFHSFMRTMSMAKRRYIFYVLIGERFKTLYDLEALSNSANLVVNDAEIPHIDIILKKAIPEYETLFGPLMEELRVAGK
jgi:hypothetical protein